MLILRMHIFERVLSNKNNHKIQIMYKTTIPYVFLRQFKIGVFILFSTTFLKESLSGDFQ